MVANGQVTYSSAAPYQYNSIASFSCDPGFFLQGLTNRVCQSDGLTADGAWNGTNPICAAIQCPILPALVNGFIAYSEVLMNGVNFMEIASYSCDRGFALVGEANRTCSSGVGGVAQWTGSEPTCEAITCSSLPILGNGLIVYDSSTPAPYDYGTTARYDCNPGFGLDGGDTVLTCGGDGSSTAGMWNGTSPTCEGITCPALSAIPNGGVTYSSDVDGTYPIATTAQYYCDEGFFLTGTTNRTCGGNGDSSSGSWSLVQPSCTPILCQSLDVPNNGLVSYSPDMSVPFDYLTVATYSCNPGYALSDGVTRRTCSIATIRGGEWTGQASSCEPVMCPALPAVMDGTILYSPDSTPPFMYQTVANISCDSGYTIMGDTIRTCGGDQLSINGSWSGDAPICTGIACPTLTEPSNGVIAFTSDPEDALGLTTTATYSCDPGYSLVGGDAVRTCIGPGGWTGTAPTCQAIVCPELLAPGNSMIQYSSLDPYTVGTSAYYSCAPGFAIGSGDRVIMCGGDGSSTTGVWMGTVPTCDVIICPSLTLNNTAITYLPEASPFEYGTVATYSCLEGFYSPDDKPPQRTCLGDDSDIMGQWNGTETVCIAIVCGALEVPANGAIDYSRVPPYAYNTVATYSCTLGHTLSGPQTRTCSDAGTWTGPQPTCVAVMCPSLPAPDNGVITYSGENSGFMTVATYDCNDGYGMPGGGDPQRTCDSLGQWTGTAPTCEAITCPSLPILGNGLIVYDSSTPAPYDYGTTARYDCNPGFGLDGGDIVLTCGGDGSSTAGVWNGTSPTCEVIGCGSVAIANGQVSYNSENLFEPFAYGTLLTYTCDAGYTLLGPESRVCEGDGANIYGQWSGAAPVCSSVECPLLPEPSNGTVSYSEGSPVSASYSCEEGYGLSGERVITCVGVEWTPQPPSCQVIMCGTLAPPTNGRVTFSTGDSSSYSFGTFALFSCDIGYQLVGSDTSTCGGDDSSSVGSWSVTSATCQAITCSSLPILGNGLIVYDSSTPAPYDYGTTARYDCNPGFGLDGGDTVLTCGTDGTWSGTSPTCQMITCPLLPQIANGLANYYPQTSDSIISGTVWNVTCNDGFTLRGDEQRICEGDGSSSVGVWSGTEPVCSDVVCPDLPELMNGMVTFSHATPTTITATYDCDLGFGLSGEPTRTCTEGVWSGEAPQCQPITCPDLSPPANGQVLYSDRFYGSTASYICDAGYGFGGGDQTLSCEGDGSSPVGLWSGTVPTCQAIECPALVAPDNGMLSLTEDNTYGSIASVLCDIGFTIVDGDSVFSCEGDGSSTAGMWSGTVPTCQAITCISAPGVENAELSYSSGGPDEIHDFGSTLSYTCETGYSLVGDAVRVCVEGVASGMWSGVAPVCSAVVCPDLPQVVSGSITFVMNTPSSITATYSCDLGFGLSGGEAVRTCEEGVWSGTPPLCEVVMCSGLAPPENGFLTYNGDIFEPYEYGTIAMYYCNEGYSLVGDETSTCGGDGLSTQGSWSLTPPVCQAITCPSLPILGNGLIVYDSSTPAPYDYGTTARYDCNPGFGLVGGDTVLTCGTDGLSNDGVWTGIVPSCEVIMCASLPDVSNGAISYSSGSLEYSTMATYSCDNGYSLVGSSVRTCGGDGESVLGTWSGAVPVCSNIVCPMLTDPSNGVISFTQTATMTTATYSCDTGYGLSGGDSIRSCTGGDWSGSQPTCEAIQCPELTAPDNTLLQYTDSSRPYDSSAVFFCATGYGTDEDLVLHCEGDGSSAAGMWSGTVPTCQAITCPELSIDNGAVVYSSDASLSVSYGTTATYSCDEGFVLEGSAVRTCGGDGSSAAGAFDGVQPICSVITCSELPAPVNGMVDYGPISPPLVYGTMAVYSCAPGFLLTGQSTRTCVGGTDWSGTAATCTGPGVPTDLSYTTDSADCHVVTISWAPPSQGDVTLYRVTVTGSSGIPDSVTVNQPMVVLSHLQCCEEYGFSVAAGNEQVVGDSVMDQNGFRTRPDITDPAKVTVMAPAPDSLTVSWVESASSGSSHLPTDTFTIAAVPSCRDGQNDFTTPSPQTVPYNAMSTVIFNNLEPDVPYTVTVQGLYCSTLVSLYEALHTTTAVDPGAVQTPTITSAERLDSDPARISIAWDKTPNVVDATVYYGDTFNMKTTVSLASATNSEYEIEGLDICTPYRIRIRSAVCAAESYSSSVQVNIEDTKPFELSFKLEDQSTCTSYIQTDGDQKVSNIETEMMKALASSLCGEVSQTITCFAGSTIVCGANPSTVYFTSSLVGHGTSSSSALQEVCLNNWLNSSPRITITPGETPLVLAQSDRSTGGLPTYAIAIIVVVILLLLVVVVLAVVIYAKYRRRFSKKLYFTDDGGLSINNATYAENPFATASPNPLFSAMETEETPPDYNSLAAKDKEAEAEASAADNDVVFSPPGLPEGTTDF